MPDIAAELAEAISSLMRGALSDLADVRATDSGEIEVADSIVIGPRRIVTDLGDEVFVDRPCAADTVFAAASFVLCGDVTVLAGEVAGVPVYEVFGGCEKEAAIFSPVAAFIKWPTEYPRRTPISGRSCFGRPGSLVSEDTSLYLYGDGLAAAIGDMDIFVTTPFGVINAPLSAGKLSIEVATFGDVFHVREMLQPREALAPIGLREMEGDDLSVDAGPVTASVTVGEDFATFISRTGFHSVVGAWRPSAGDATVVSPPGSPQSDVATFPAVPLWDELLDALGVESPVLAIKKMRRGLVMLTPDGEATAHPLHLAGDHDYEWAAVLSPARGSDARRLEKISIEVGWSRATPPLSLDEGFVLVGDEDAGETLWVTRFGDIYVAEFSKEVSDLRAIFVAADSVETLVAEVERMIRLRFLTSNVSCESLAAAAVAASQL